MLDCNPPLGNNWHSLAKVMQTNGEHGAANLAMERYVAHCSTDSQGRFLQAAMLAQSKRRRNPALCGMGLA